MQRLTGRSTPLFGMADSTLSGLQNVTRFRRCPGSKELTTMVSLLGAALRNPSQNWGVPPKHAEGSISLRRVVIRILDFRPFSADIASTRRGGFR